jgi:2'-5' RNA ligase
VADASRSCRALYEQMEATTLECGLDAEQVLLSAARYRERRAGRDFVTPDAYRPTGAALGSPLPDEGASRRLSSVAEGLERFLRGARANAGSWFAFVPEQSYHVTVVNRGHFDTSDVISLDASMRAQLASVVRSYPAITLDLDGIAITRQGRVLAKCIPRGDDLALLRARIVGEIPELAENMPRTAHIKLGHVLLPLTAEETSSLVAFAKSFDASIRGALLFRDLFTPAGRVPLAAPPTP